MVFKQSSVDDYAPNPLLLPPSPSTTRFIAPSSLNASTLSSSPLRPTLHSMASSSSLSSSYGSISGHANGGRNSNTSHGIQQQQQHQQQFASSSSLSGQGSSVYNSSVSAHTATMPPNLSTSPSSLPQFTSNSNISSTTLVPNNAPANSTKSVMNITSPSYPPSGSSYANSNAHANTANQFLSFHNASTSSLVASNSQTHLSHHHHHHHHQHQHQHHSNHQSINGGHSHHSHLHQQQQQLQQQHHQQQQQQLQNQLQNMPIHLLLVTPEPRALQMDSLRRSEDLMEELQMTVSDLSQWLQVFETGIKSVRSS